MLRLIHSLVRNHRIDSTSQVQTYYHYQDTYPSKPKQAAASGAQQRYEELVDMFEGKFNIKGKWQLEAKSQLAYALLHEATPVLTGGSFVIRQKKTKRPWAASYLRYEMYKSASTNTEFHMLDRTSTDLLWDRKKGYITDCDSADSMDTDNFADADGDLGNESDDVRNWHDGRRVSRCVNSHEPALNDAQCDLRLLLTPLLVSQHAALSRELSDPVPSGMLI